MVILLVLIAQSLGVLIGAIAPTIKAGVSAAPLAVLPHLIFCGFFINLSNLPLPVQWLQYLSFVRYSFEGLIINEYDGVFIKTCNPVNPSDCFNVPGAFVCVCVRVCVCLCVCCCCFCLLLLCLLLCVCVCVYVGVCMFFCFVCVCGVCVYVCVCILVCVCV